MLAGLMRAPFVATEPAKVRVATFSVRDSVKTKVRVLVSAEISEVRGGGLVTGFVLVDAKGKAAATGGQRLAETGTTDPVTWLGTASVEPGIYTLKLSVVDGPRDGAERRARRSRPASPAPEGSSRATCCSGPYPPGRLRCGRGSIPEAQAAPCSAISAPRPDAGLLKAATVSLEVAETAEGEAVLTTPATATDAPEGDRRVAQGAIPLDVLPPGDYVVRAAVAVGGKPVGTALVPALPRAPVDPGGGDPVAGRIVVVDLPLRPRRHAAARRDRPLPRSHGRAATGPADPARGRGRGARAPR